ncbi:MULTISPECIES: F0F1 ATP synthase subunit A [unclassified Campylobacter]|uniref:F0F1 ATP synthase subunit A n=1 Tax=unclassified Campylobacter TaxID=2593542 RepID=UPI0014734567|nr:MULTISPECIES: F0F1 ATP synthase subunit A [unclassified Campylobacter]QKG29439.1 ATP synthase, F0 complex, a subunit [Campylobacter sp. RM16187]
MEENLFLFSNVIASQFTSDKHVMHMFTYAMHFLLAAVIVIAFSKLAVKNMQLVPRGTQNVFEAYLEAVISMGKDVLGSESLARKYLPLVATIGLIIFTSNVMGIIPGFESPTASLNMTLTLALIVFVFYHFEGIKKNGVIKYFAHFMGPSKALAPLMFFVEIISHLSRIVSLSFRLFGNIKGDDLFLLVMLALAPFIAPLPAYALLTLMAILQTFIFMMLTFVYLAGALATEEH